jgi:hypothetical protein
LATSLCIYVKFNGVPCGSPSLRGKVFCYHHARSRTARQSNIVIPPPDSPDAVMYTNHALLQLMFNKKITIGEYRAAVHGFRITATLMKMSEKCADATRVTDVSRHIATDIAFAGPDADIQDENVAVGARLASPAAEEDQVTARDSSRADEGESTVALAAAVHYDVCADLPIAEVEPPIELQPNSRTPAALGATVTHAGLADPINLDPRLVENAKLEPRPAVPPEYKFPPRPLTQDELDNPYVRPSGDAVRDYLEREYRKRGPRWG